MAGNENRTSPLVSVSIGPVKTSPSGKLRSPLQGIHVRPATPTVRSVSSASTRSVRTPDSGRRSAPSLLGEARQAADRVGEVQPAGPEDEVLVGGQRHVGVLRERLARDRRSRTSAAPRRPSAACTAPSAAPALPCAAATLAGSITGQLAGVPGGVHRDPQRRSPPSPASRSAATSSAAPRLASDRNASLRALGDHPHSRRCAPISSAPRRRAPPPAARPAPAPRSAPAARPDPSEYSHDHSASRSTRGSLTGTARRARSARRRRRPRRRSAGRRPCPSAGPSGWCRRPPGTPCPSATWHGAADLLVEGDVARGAAGSRRSCRRPPRPGSASPSSMSSIPSQELAAAAGLVARPRVRPRTTAARRRTRARCRCASKLKLMCPRVGLVSGAGVDLAVGEVLAAVGVEPRAAGRRRPPGRCPRPRSAAPRTRASRSATSAWRADCSRQNAIGSGSSRWPAPNTNSSKSRRATCPRPGRPRGGRQAPPRTSGSRRPPRARRSGRTARGIERRPQRLAVGRHRAQVAGVRVGPDRERLVGHLDLEPVELRDGGQLLVGAHSSRIAASTAGEPSAAASDGRRAGSARG